MYSAVVKRRAVASTLFLLSLAFAGSTFPDYPVTRAKECPVSAEKNGVIIGLASIEDPQAQKTYFQANFTKKGFIPILLVIENGTSEETFLFDKTKITYGAASAAVPPAHLGSEAGKALALSVIPFLGRLAAAQVVTTASHIRQNLLKKEIQSTTLSHGVSVQGFLYIPVPKKNTREKIAVRVPISKAGTDETFDLNLIF